MIHEPIKPPRGVHDPARLAALKSYGILDTPPEEGFDDIVQLARRLCGAPVALVSLVAGDRQWFKARAGFPDCETGLNASVCAHVLAEPDLLVIPDLATDARTRDNPLVTGPPFIQFYAGAPLRTPEGHVLGSLCVIDHRPRREGLSDSRRDALRALARQVVTQMELRRALAEQQAAVRERKAQARTQEAIAGSGGDLDVILKAVVAGAMRAVPAAEGGVLQLLDGDELEYRSVRGSLSAHAGLRVPLRGSLAGACAREASAMLVPDVREDGRVKADLVETLRLRSAILAPVIRAGRVLGVLKLQSSRPAALDEHDLMLVRTFATLAATGLAEASEVAARRLVAESEARLKTVTDHVGQAVFQMDAGGDIAFANPAAETMFGWRVGEMLGRSLHDLIHHHYPDGRPYPADECPLRAALVHGRLVTQVEETVFRRDGTPLRVLVDNAPIRVGDDVVGAVMTVTDVTERMRADDARRESERFTAALLELGDRLRDLSHVPEMTRAAAQIAGRTLGASRVGFGALDAAAEHVDIEPDWTAPGQVSVAGRHRFEDYGDVRFELREGRASVVADVRTDRRTAADPSALLAIDALSVVDMPIRERGRTTTLFFVHDRRPRHWTDAELAFIRAVADRIETGVARVRAQEHQHLLNRELSHRMKNLLAMVQSIATQSMRNASDVAAARNVLSGRLIALSRAHDLLMGGALSSTEMEGVVRAALDLHSDRQDRFRLSGPPVIIGTDQALSLALTLHELATNAAKYGALSNAGGYVSLSWDKLDQEGGPSLRLRWKEDGGPPVVPPTRKGFGSRFIERGLATQVGGSLTLDYPPEGVICTLTAPLDAFQRGH